MTRYHVTIDLNSLSYEVDAESEEDAVELGIQLAEQEQDWLSSCYAFAEAVEGEGA